MFRKITEVLTIFLTGGIVYFYAEILMRGYSHISMFLLGGLCFFLVGKLGNKLLRKNYSFAYKIILIMALSGTIITTLEFITGMIVNRYMGLGVWDYSYMKYNYLGQICLMYSGLWCILGLPCVYFYGMINRFVFGCEEV